MEQRRVLFVCTGNICRSPMAEGVFKKKAAERGLADRYAAESAGTHGYHTGKPPHGDAQAVAKARGYDLSDQRARTVEPEDFERYDLIIALDEGHFDILSRAAGEGRAGRVRRLLDFYPDAGRPDVPDPYFGERQEFEYALDLVEGGIEGLLDALEKGKA